MPHNINRCFSCNHDITKLAAVALELFPLMRHVARSGVPLRNLYPIVREVSQGWNINISYDKDGNIVQIVILEAKENGFYPAKSLRGFLQHTSAPVPIDQLCKPVEYTDDRANQKNQQG